MFNAAFQALIIVVTHLSSYEEFIIKMRDSEADFMSELSQLSVV